MKKNLLTLFLLTALLTISTCDTVPTGDLNENNPPSTFLTLESINREGDFRLSSQINISWWGTDSDGFIVGYEYAINDTSESAWNFTTKTDSTFILPITEGLSEDDVLFKIRAIDNNGAKDPIGANLVFPIVNSEPSVTINRNLVPPDTLFSIASFGWTINDIDGISNIARTEVVLNDTTLPWVTIPIPEDDNNVFINLQFDNSTSGEKTASVFLGRSFTTAPDLSIPGLVVGEENTFYVRVIDNAGAVSPKDSISWYIKPKVSNTLLINDAGGSASAATANFHLNLLSQIGIEPDVWNVNDGAVLSDLFPTVIDPTLLRTLAEWDHIYWLSSGVSRNISFTQEIADQFFDEGGTMFVTFPMGETSQNNPLFNFLPVDSIGVLEGIQISFQVNANTLVEPINGFNGPVLELSRRVNSVYPLKPIPGAIPLYETNFLATTVIGITQDYVGSEVIAIENAEGNLIFFGFDLSVLDGSDNISDMLDQVLIQELNFKQ